MKGKHVVYLSANAVLVFFLLTSAALAARHDSLYYSVDLPEGWRVDWESGLDAYSADGPGEAGLLWIDLNRHENADGESFLRDEMGQLKRKSPAAAPGWLFVDVTGYRSFLSLGEGRYYAIINAREGAGAIKGILESMRPADHAPQPVRALIEAVKDPEVAAWLASETPDFVGRDNPWGPSLYTAAPPEGWELVRYGTLDAYESPGAENSIWIRAERNDGLTAEQIITALEEDYALLSLADSAGYFYVDEDGWRGFIIADETVSFDILVQTPFAGMPAFLASLKATNDARAMEAFFAVLRRPAVVDWLSFSSGQ